MVGHHPFHPPVFAAGAARLPALTILLTLLGLGALAQAQEPLPVENLTDRSTHDQRVWFRVPSVPGHGYQVRLDGQPVPTDLVHWVETPDYHELLVARTRTADGVTTNRLLRFIVQSDRGNPEKGLIRWTPYPVIDSTAAEFAGARLTIIVPAAYPTGLPIPVVAWVDDATGRERRANGWVTAPGFETAAFPVRRGVGSGFLPAATAGGPLVYAARLQTLSDPKAIQIETGTSWTAVSGVLPASTVWPPNSRIRLRADLTVPAGLTLTVGAGTVVQLEPLVNLTNHGRIVIEGTRTAPVVFTATHVVHPGQPAGAWGGFLMRGPAAELTARGAFFTGGGGGEDFDFSPGASHRSEQAVFLVHGGARLALTNCYVLNTAGQVGNGHESELTFDHCLLQRAITGGEYAGGTVVINHSAWIEFPEEGLEADAAVANADYDALYFTEGTHILRDSLFGFAMDDALDSGSGGAGTMLLTNCWIESALHEAQAWSGGGRRTWTYDTVAMNSGQGIEAGWSTGDGSPDCFADGLLAIANAVGARVGDNYNWSYNGFLRLTNSLVLHNHRDLFWKSWDSGGWTDRVAQVDFRGNRVTAGASIPPDNAPWDPAVDAGQLARWMTTPPEAPVGLGLALRTNRFPMTELFAGVPVRLSSFTPHPVTVDFTFASPGGPLASGTLVFAPGETVKRIPPTGFDVFAHDEVRLVLGATQQGELTGLTEAVFAGPTPVPTLACWVATNALLLDRLPEGLLVHLSTPAANPVSVDYRFTTGDALLRSGSLVFPPGVTVARLEPPGFDPSPPEGLEVSLGNSRGAPLGSPVRVVYGTVPLEVAFAADGLQPDPAGFDAGIPVALNRPAPGVVKVAFRCEASGGVLTNGTLEFAPGQSGQTLRLPSVDPAAHDLILVRLVAADSARLAPADRVFLLPAAPRVTPVLVAGGSRWKYRDTGGDPDPDWYQTAYDDQGWSNGLAQLGFGDQDEATLLRSVGTNGQNSITFYFRQQFPVADPAAFTNLTLELLRDDGGVVYLNGTEVYRSPTLPAPPAAITPATLANQGPGGTAPPDNAVDRAELDPRVLRPGANGVAVEVHQYRADSSDVSFELTLTGAPVPPPPPPRLSWGRFQDGDVLAWSEARFGLAAAETIEGPWRRLDGAWSPFRIGVGERPMFFRLQR